MKSSKTKSAWPPKRVRALRERLGDTQEAFAHRLGVSWVTVSRWENGKNGPVGLAVRALEGLDEK